MSYHGGMGQWVAPQRVQQPGIARMSPARQHQTMMSMFSGLGSANGRQKLANIQKRLSYDVSRGALTQRQAQREYKRLARLVANGKTPPYARPMSMQTYRGQGGLNGILAVL